MIKNPLSNQWYLCYYIPGNKTDEFSQYLLKFKNGDVTTILKWLQWSVDEIRAINVQFDYVIRVLGSSEVEPSGNSPLDYLGQYIEQELKFPFLPNMVRKTRQTKKMSSLLRKVDRDAELEDVYKTLETCPDLAGKRLLLLDDIATSGASSSAIIRTIRTRFPTATVYLFTLGKTLRDDAANEGIFSKYFSRK